MVLTLRDRATFHSRYFPDSDKNHNTLPKSFPLSFLKVDLDNDLRQCYDKRNHLGRDGPVPMWEHYEELYLKTELRMTELPNYRHWCRTDGTSTPCSRWRAPDFVICRMAVVVRGFLVTALEYAQRSDLPP
jgi:hypothetical protein